MDAPVNTTRRDLFAAGAGLAALAVPIAATAATSARTSDAEFIRSLELMFPNGGLAARHALAAGMRPDQLWTILCPYPRSKDEPTLWPALMFRTDDNGNRTFRPCGGGQ